MQLCSTDSLDRDTLESTFQHNDFVIDEQCIFSFRQMYFTHIEFWWLPIEYDIKLHSHDVQPIVRDLEHEKWSIFLSLCQRILEIVFQLNVLIVLNKTANFIFMFMVNDDLNETEQWLYTINECLKVQFNTVYKPLRTF